MSWLEELKTEDLRGDYAELAEVIGLELTVKVAEELGGLPLLLPRIEINSPDDLRSGYLDLHPIIGFDLCLKVSDMVAPNNGERSGGQLWLPKADTVFFNAKVRYILKHDRVSNRRQLARDTKLSMCTVYRICKEKTQERRRKKDENPDQIAIPW